MQKKLTSILQLYQNKTKEGTQRNIAQGQEIVEKMFIANSIFIYIFACIFID